MIRRVLSPLVPLTVLSLFVACSAEDSNNGNNSGVTGGTTSTGGTIGSGGVTSGTGAAAATGGSGGAGTGGIVGTGATTGTGGIVGTGATTGAGGTSTGGGGNTAGFTCPTVTAGATPTLGTAATLLATSPEWTGLEGGSQMFIEGPVWANGALYVSQLRMYGTPPDAPPARILKLNGTSFEEAIAEAGTNGLAIRGDGKLVAASHKAKGIVAFDLSAPTAAPAVIADKFENTAFNSPNDLVLRADGNIYFTDPDYQCKSGCGAKRVYRIDPTGAVTTIASTHTQPNGIALSPNGNTLYVAGDGALEKFAVAADGSLGAREVFASVSGVDGLGVDCAGNIYTANAPYGKVGVYKPDGSLHGSIDVGAQVTNVAFGGADSKTLYITLYDKPLYSVTLDIPGYPY